MDADGLPAGFQPIGTDAESETALLSGRDAPGLLEIDHFAICVKVDELDATVAYYKDAFGFSEIFGERMVIGSQAMLSAVVQSRSGDITFTIIQPDPEAEPGQIDGFLADHDCAGVQHIAFSSDDAAHTVRALARRGVEFLGTPSTYYELLSQRVTQRKHELSVLQELSILVDEDHAGQLFQIFTRSTHSRSTLFFEIIERLGAKTFGSSNIRALYEAVELERQREYERSLSS